MTCTNKCEGRRARGAVTNTRQREARPRDEARESSDEGKSWEEEEKRKKRRRERKRRKRKGNTGVWRFRHGSVGRRSGK
jgi:hypothetical protein